MQPQSRRSIWVSSEQPVRTYLILIYAGITVLVAAFLFAAPSAKAQDITAEVQVQSEETETQEDASKSEDEQGNEPAESSEVLATEPASEPQPQEPSVDVLIDNTVTAQTLEVGESRILPDSPLYGLKRFGRGLRKVFTFDTQKKVELEVKYANQELVDTQRLIEQNTIDATSVQHVADAAKRLDHALESVKKHVADAADQGEGSAAITRVLDSQIKQQKFLEQLEKQIVKKAPEHIANAIATSLSQAREEAAAHVAEAVGNVSENPEELSRIFERVLEQQQGSDFKHVRNLEVLRRLEDRVPEQARDAIRRAEENTLKRFSQDFNQLPEGDRAHRFQQYVAHVDGDETRHLEVFDHLKSLEGVSPEIAQEIEFAKDTTAKRFQERLESYDEKFTDEVIRDQFRARAFERFERVSGDQLEKLRVLEDIKQRATFNNEAIKQKFEEKRSEAVEKFKSTFPDNDSQAQAEQFRALSKKMSENPDPTTFRLIMELEEKVKSDPKKRAFLEEIERETKAKFIAEAQQNGEKFFERISSSNPQDIEVFKQLKEEFEKDPSAFGPPPFGPEGFRPPGVGLPSEFPGQAFGGSQQAGNVFDNAIRAHTENLQMHIEKIEDPGQFRQLQEKFFQGSPEIAQEIQRHQEQFRTLFEQKRQSIGNQGFGPQDQQAYQNLEQERRKFEEEFRVRQETAGTEEDRARLEEEGRKREEEFARREYDIKREGFTKQLEQDPFCDERCRQEEKDRFDQIHANQERKFQELFGQMDKRSGREGGNASVRELENPSFEQRQRTPQFPGQMSLEQQERFKIEMEARARNNNQQNPRDPQLQRSEPGRMPPAGGPEDLEFRKRAELENRANSEGVRPFAPQGDARFMDERMKQELGQQQLDGLQRPQPSGEFRPQEGFHRPEPGSAPPQGFFPQEQQQLQPTQ